MAAFSCADFVSARTCSSFTTTQVHTENLQALCAWYIDCTQSRRSAWYFGIGLLTVGSVLFGFSCNVVTLYLSQILQGASSAILYTVGLAVLVDTVDPKKVGRWLGMAMSFNSFGLVIGPTVGGIVYEKAPLGKIAVFAITIALGVVGIVLRLMIKEQPRSKSVNKAAAFNPVSLRPLVHEDEGSQRGRKDFRPITTTTTTTTMTVSSVPVPKISPRSEVFHFRHVWVLVKSRRLVAAFIGIFINEM